MPSTRRTRRQIVVTYGSYINSTSKESNGCTPDGFSAFGLNTYTGVKTAGACNNKILLSVSTNGGAGFTGGAVGADPRTQATVNVAKQASSDQWWQWAAFNKDGKLAVSYYDRQYGDDEMTGSLRLQPLRLERPVQLRREAGHVVVDASADPVLGHVLR